MNGDSPGRAGSGAAGERQTDGENVPSSVPERSRSVGRRKYLALLGIAAASLAGCADEGSDGQPTTTATDEPTTAEDRPSPTPSRMERFGNYRGIEFDRVLDAVGDLGMDPSGEVAVDAELANALATPGTLILFPEGRYRFSASVNLTAQRVGLLGTDNVRFVPEPGFGSLLLDGQNESLDDVLIENVDVDIRSPDTTAGIRIRCLNRFHIQDVEFLGRGTNDSPGGTTSAFLLAIANESGRGVMRNAVAKKGSRIDGYQGGNGRIGVWVGWSNEGTVRIENCDFREFGNNGIYASRTPGQVEVVNSYFLNNNVSGVRIGGEGSYVEDCTIEIDLDLYTGPTPITLAEFNTRGIVVEQGLSKPGPPLPEGAEIRGCLLQARRSPRSQAVIEQSPTARSLLVRDTEVQCDIDGTPAIRRGPPGSIQYRPDRQKPPKPYWTHLRNVTIDGSAAGGVAVDLRLAPGSTVANCEIDGTGTDRDGILFDHAPESELFASDIRTDGHPVIVSTEPTSSPERQLLCLGVETELHRFGEDSAAGNLTGDPSLFQTLSRNSRTDTVCLGLAPDVSTLPLIESITGSLRISIDALDEGTPIGRLLNSQ